MLRKMSRKKKEKRYENNLENGTEYCCKPYIFSGIAENHIFGWSYFVRICLVGDLAWSTRKKKQVILVASTLLFFVLNHV